MHVWSSNWPALGVFLACATQWRVAAGFGAMAMLGLDYPAVEVVMRQRSVADPAVFADVQVMEAAALPVLNLRDDA